MNIEQQRYYEDRLAMMGSKAWKDLIEDVQGMIAATDTLSGVTVDTIRFKQGELSIMRWMTSLEEMSNLAYEDLKNE